MIQDSTKKRNAKDVCACVALEASPVISEVASAAASSGGGLQGYQRDFGITRQGIQTRHRQTTATRLRWCVGTLVYWFMCHRPISEYSGIR